MPTGEDLYVSRHLSDKEIVGAVSPLYSVAANLVLVSHGLGNWLSHAEAGGIQVVCVVHELASGDFPLLVQTNPIYSVPDIVNRLEAVGWLCEVWNCEIVIPWRSKARNPYLFMLVRGKGNYQKVLLDPDLMNDDENPGILIAGNPDEDKSPS